MDGYVTIGTKLDTKGLEKDLNKAQRELLKLDSEAERLQEKKIFIELDLKDYYKSIEKVKEATDRDLYLYGKTDEQAQQILEMEEETLQNIDEQYAKQLQKLSLINAKIKENADAQENMKGQVASLNEKLSDAKGLDNFSKNFSSIGKSISNIIGKVGRWALALLGVRTVLSILTQSFNTLSQYNTDLSAKMQGIKLMLASAFEPIINWLIKGLQIVMRTIAIILKTLFGIDILARASELASKNTSKNMGSTAKSAKEVRKQLAGFDEMNVLGDNVDTAGGGAGGIGDITADFDIDGMEKLDEFFNKVQKVADWIKTNWPIIKSTAMGGIWEITKALGPKGLLSVLGGVPTAVIANWNKIKPYLMLAWEFAKIICGNIWQTIKETATKIWDTVKEIFGKIRDKAYEISMGFVIYFQTAWGKIKEGATTMWNGVKTVFTTFHNTVANIIGTVINVFANLWNKFYEGGVNAWNKVKEIFGNVVSFFSGIINTIIGFFREIGTRVGDAIGGAFKNAINGVLKAIESILNSPIKAINKMLDIINPILPKKLSKLSTFSLPRLAKGGIINQPGRGVMVGGAIAGESGREGVIPLTDSQQMALLGEAIGKYITINANITNTMNGRVISRELQKIQNANDFAYNS